MLRGGEEATVYGNRGLSSPRSLLLRPCLLCVCLLAVVDQGVLDLSWLRSRCPVESVFALALRPSIYINSFLRGKDNLLNLVACSLPENGHKPYKRYCFCFLLYWKISTVNMNGSFFQSLSRMYCGLYVYRTP